MSARGPLSGAARGTTPEMREVIAWAEGQGWSVALTGGTHLVFVRPGRRKIFAAFTGGRRSALYARSALRRSQRAT